MQVQLFTIIAVIAEILIALLTPIATYLYYHHHQNLRLKPVIVGAIIWLVVTQFLEKGINLIIIAFTPITHSPLLFALYAAVIAGVFEEMGRMLAFKKFFMHNNQWKNGFAYGLGHGGIESIVVGALAGIQLLTCIILINSGQIAVLKKLLPHQFFIHTINTIYGTPIIFLIGGIERISAFALQIGLSLLVLFSIKQRQVSFLFIAIILHILADLAPALYQTGQFNLWVTEIIVVIFGVGSLIWIKKSKKLFS